MIKKHFIQVLILFILINTQTGCTKKNYYNPNQETKKADAQIVIESITLDKQEITLNLGETTLVNATISPSNAIHNPVKWASSNDKIISVNSQGVIFGKRAGKAFIEVADASGHISAKCNVVVNSIKEAVITGNIPAQAKENEKFRVEVRFENCLFPSVMVISDCGGGSIKTDSDSIGITSKPGQYQVIGNAVITFNISGAKETNHIRILCFDNGELFDCKEYNISLIKNEQILGE